MASMAGTVLLHALLDAEDLGGHSGSFNSTLDLREGRLDESYPTDEGDHNHERTPRPDIVRENHRQPSGQRDYADDQHHRRILKKGGHRLHGSLPASHHRERDDNAVQTDQPA